MPEAVTEAAAESQAPRLKVEMVPVVALESVWPLVEPMLSEALDGYPLETLDDVRESIETTHRQLWVLLRDGEIIATMVTQIVPFPRARVLEIMALAGKDVATNFDAIDAWATDVARERACEIVQVIGRDGWTPLFKRVGGRRAATIYRKEIG